jgi:hypothetical protein
VVQRHSQQPLASGRDQQLDDGETHLVSQRLDGLRSIKQFYYSTTIEILPRPINGRLDGSAHEAVIGKRGQIK